MKQHLSVTELATRVGRKRATVSHWEAGRFAPPAPILPKLAKALGISVERLVGEGLTEEQKETERRYLEHIINGGEALIERLSTYTSDEILALLPPRDATKAP